MASRLKELLHHGYTADNGMYDAARKEGLLKSILYDISTIYSGRKLSYTKSKNAEKIGFIDSILKSKGISDEELEDLKGAMIEDYNKRLGEVIKNMGNIPISIGNAPPYFNQYIYSIYVAKPEPAEIYGKYYETFHTLLNNMSTEELKTIHEALRPRILPMIRR